MEKVTKRVRYEQILSLIDEAVDHAFEDYDFAGLREFCDKEIEALDRKAAKAKERAAEKKAEADELYDVVISAVTDEFEPIADIAARIEGDGVTASKVAYRLNQAAKNGVLEKGEVVIETDGKKRKAVAYKLI